MQEDIEIQQTDTEGNAEMQLSAHSRTENIWSVLAPPGIEGGFQLEEQVHKDRR